MRDVMIVEAARTSVRRGKPGGRFHEERPAALLARTLRTLIERTRIHAGLADDVVSGCLSQTGEQSLNTASILVESPWTMSVGGGIDGFCRG
jgi:acetyl-CoA acyltransferase